MTNDEKKDFEQHKKQAEKQIQDIYYGNKSRIQNQDGLKMPHFLSKTPQKNNSTEQTTQQSVHEEKKAINSKSTRGNLLELINFKNIKMDNDRLIILSLCLLLSAEEADEMLLLALIYIML